MSKVKQKQVKEDYHLACQNCGVTDKPLHLIPLRNDKNVVGLIVCCDNCDDKLRGQNFGLTNKHQDHE